MLQGRKSLRASLDTYIYGMLNADNVLSAMGADVVEGGVDNTPQSVLDITDGEDVKYIDPSKAIRTFGCNRLDKKKGIFACNDLEETIIAIFQKLYIKR